MKKIFVIILLILTTLSSCIEDVDGPQVLTTSLKNVSFSGKASSWAFTVNSNADWEITGVNDWCNIDTVAGYGTKDLILSVKENNTGVKRKHILELAGAGVVEEISITQDMLINSEDYELPVVFHIIYSDASDTKQNISKDVLMDLLDRSNELLNKTISSIALDVTLVPATLDPDSNVLAEPGIHRVLRSNSAVKDANYFLSVENTVDMDLSWNPNEYVNLFVFEFVDKNVAGASVLPFTPAVNSLDGLVVSQYFYTNLPDQPWGIVLNNKYLLDEEMNYITLAHEMGHYLGLLHPFAEKDCETETDYCDDTPSYDRHTYEAWLKENIETASPAALYEREGCDGSHFTSYNVMDYYHTYSREFTSDQYARVRHVLENSPLIPGPKNVNVSRVSVGCIEKPVVRIIE